MDAFGWLAFYIAWLGVFIWVPWPWFLFLLPLGIWMSYKLANTLGKESEGDNEDE